MKTTIFKLLFAFIFLSFGLSYANENPLQKLLNDSEFVKFTKTHGLNQEVLMKTEYKVTQFEVMNSEIYEYNLANNENLIIVRDKQNNTAQYFYGALKQNSRIIIDKNNVNVLEVENDLKCVTDTVDYMKKSCDANTTCKIACDLSPNCIPYMYVVAYAHCASGKPAPKVATISTSLD